MAFTFNPITGELDIVLGTGALDTLYLRLDASNGPITSDLSITAGLSVTGALTGGGTGHDQFSDFISNEHIDWTSASQNFLTTGDLQTSNIVLTGTNIEETDFILSYASVSGSSLAIPYVKVVNTTAAQTSAYILAGFEMDAGSQKCQFFASDGTFGDPFPVGTIYRSYSGTQDFYWFATNQRNMKLSGVGQLSLPISGSSAGLLLGGDWQIYRTAANQAVIPAGDKLGFGGAPSVAIHLNDATTYFNTSNTIQMGAGAFMAGRTNQASLFEFSGGSNYYQATGWTTTVGSTTSAIFSCYLGIMYWATDSGLTSDTAFTPTTNMTLNTNGQLGIPTTGATAGILLGGDVLLYRSAANQLLIPDAIVQQETSAVLGDSRYTFRIHDDSALGTGIGGGIGFGGTYTSGNAQTHWAGIWGYKENATTGLYGGQLHFGARVHGGTIASDLILDNNGDFEIARGDLKITTGDLNHDGTNIGFYGTTPAAQSAAYTRNATIVEDRTLLASASATTLNNNNVLAALIADLQNIGILG